jgi:transposase-like protein
MDKEEIEQVRLIVREELTKIIADRSLDARYVSTAPQCPYCNSNNTNWMGNNRMLCRDCRRTKTIKIPSKNEDKSN